MSRQGIKVGVKGTVTYQVDNKDLASAYGNPGVDVLSSMTLMTLLEQACIAAIMPSLDPETAMSVGARMEMDHLAPTPPGLTVTAQAELTEIRGRKLVFTATAHDGKEQVARAVHVRYVVDRSRFLDQVAAKAKEM